MTSMRAVVDTGVLVSGLIQRAGITGEILRLLRDGRFSIVFSTPILVEVVEVLGRPAFRSKYHILPEDINVLVNLMRLRGELVTIER
jgi:putative PIN family toxin of toxin-antitoxin system